MTDDPVEILANTLSYLRSETVAVEALAEARLCVRSLENAGLVIVPREPTQAMLDACDYIVVGAESFENGDIEANIYLDVDDASVVWEAMIAEFLKPAWVSHEPRRKKEPGNPEG